MQNNLEWQITKRHSIICSSRFPLTLQTSESVNEQAITHSSFRC